MCTYRIIGCDIEIFNKQRTTSQVFPFCYRHTCSQRFQIRRSISRRLCRGVLPEHLATVVGLSAHGLERYVLLRRRPVFTYGAGKLAQTLKLDIRDDWGNSILQSVDIKSFSRVTKQTYRRPDSQQRSDSSWQWENACNSKASVEILPDHCCHAPPYRSETMRQLLCRSSVRRRRQRAFISACRNTIACRRGGRRCC